MHNIFFDSTGLFRSGWRSGLFLFFFGIAVLLLGSGVQIAMLAAGFDPKAGSATFLIVNGVVALIPAILVGWLCGRLLEKLPFDALGVAITKKGVLNFALGLAVGTATLGVAVAAVVVPGAVNFAFQTDNLSPLYSLTVSFLVFAVAAAFEEALFRGYVFQTLTRSGLAWLAIVLTSVFFGVVHLNNPNAGPISTANTLLAGVWFGIAYLKTRDLWFVWGVHLAWNWMQGSVFGIEVSGMTGIGGAPLLREIDNGPAWLTGGAYGLEGGIACTIAIVVSVAAIWMVGSKK